MGSLYGGLGNTDDKNNPETRAGSEDLRHSAQPRKSGMFVAISTTASAQQDTAIRFLRAHGATDLERAEGTMVAGEWTDFNPLTPLRLVAGGAATGHRR